MSQSTLQRFLVLGAGSWGTALAMYLAHQQHHVVLWGHHPENMQEIARTRINKRYLPQKFPANLHVASDLALAFQQAGSDPILLIVVPSFAFAELTVQIKPYLTPKTRFVIATKGLSEENDLLHLVCEKNCGPYPLAVLSGPSFAQEVAKGLPTAVSMATHSLALGKLLVDAFHSEFFRVYLSQDLIGVQLGGAIKNVLAIAVGMSDGLGFGANARSALITRGLAELARLSHQLGAKERTIMGLSGVGDVVLTCTDNQSRNRRFGLALGQGYSCEEAQQSIGQVVEGKTNAKHVFALAAKVQVEMPICEQVYAVVYQGLSPQQAVMNLLKRSPKREDFY